MTSWPITVRIEARLLSENPHLEGWIREAIENVDLGDDIVKLQLVHALHIEGYEVEVYPVEDVEQLSASAGRRMEATMESVQARIEDAVARVLRAEEGKSVERKQGDLAREPGKGSGDPIHAGRGADSQLLPSDERGLDGQERPETGAGRVASGRGVR